MQLLIEKITIDYGLLHEQEKSLQVENSTN